MGSRCQYMDKVLPVVLMGLEEGRVRQIAEQLEADTGSRERFYEWLGRDRRYHGMKGTNAVALWEEVI